MCCVRGGADEQLAGAGTTTAGPHGPTLTAANVPPPLLDVQPTSHRLPPERATATSKLNARRNAARARVGAAAWCGHRPAASTSDDASHAAERTRFKPSAG